jgi:hypothetical protein
MDSMMDSMQSIKGTLRMPLLELPATQGLLRTCDDSAFRRHMDEYMLPHMLVHFAERAFPAFKRSLMRALPKAVIEGEWDETPRVPRLAPAAALPALGVHRAAARVPAEGAR